MAVEWAFSDDVLIVRPLGAFTTEELRTAVEDAMRDAAYRPGLALLFDMRTSQMATSDEEYAARVDWAMGLTESAFRPRIAGVYAPAQHGLIERGVTLARGRAEIRTFTSMDAALEWLAGSRASLTF